MEKFVKGTYGIMAVKVPAGIKIYNYLEDVSYVTDENRCIVLTGTKGEQWPVTLAKLSKSYTMPDGSLITEANLPDESFKVLSVGGGDPVYARKTTEQEEVQTSWGDKLISNRAGVPHGDGDYVVKSCSNPADTWVVNGLVFKSTYKKMSE